MDSEDVRELLTQYFDGARTIVDRYGGVVEKFIGDAVMAVWGVPKAHEDDAERAVRAGLELVDMATTLGDSAGVADAEVTMRVGIVTGEVTATLNATQQGLVAGRRGEHRLPGSVDRAAGAGLGRRDHPKAGGGGDRLRRGRRAHVERQVDSDSAVLGRQPSSEASADPNESTGLRHPSSAGTVSCGC